MKKTITLLTIFISAIGLSAQHATFEKFISIKDAVLNGKSTAPASPIFFKDSGFNLSSTYDTSFGGYWSAGIAINSMTDTINGTFTNLYSSVTASGAGGSAVYGTSQNNSLITLDLISCSGAQSAYLSSIDITNTYYAAEVMKNGNRFSKKFTGADKDSFVLWIYQYFVNNFVDSTKVYLADFTQTDTTENFILRDWKTVEFPSIVPTDSIKFKLVSSDNNSFGINTPTFFALDNLRMTCAVSTEDVQPIALSLYPNPTNANITIETNDKILKISLFDAQGKRVSFQRNRRELNISELKSGMYIINIETENELWQEQIIKY